MIVLQIQPIQYKTSLPNLIGKKGVCLCVPWLCEMFLRHSFVNPEKILMRYVQFKYNTSLFEFGPPLYCMWLWKTATQLPFLFLFSPFFLLTPFLPAA